MPKKITKTVYTFRELLALKEKGEVTATAYQAARDKLAKFQTEGEWYEFTEETWQDALEQIGFTDAKISFRGFWSQGDGASFTSGVDVEKLVAFLADDITPKDCIEGNPEDFRPWILHKLKSGRHHSDKFRKLLRVRDYIDASVERTDSHYAHENTCDFKADLGSTGNKPGQHCRLLWTLFDDFIKAGEDLRKGLCQAIYRDLEADYESQVTDEALTEFGEANDYYFTKSGAYER